MNDNNQILKISRLEKINKKSSLKNIISEFSLETCSNKTNAFLFTSNNTKEKFINILSGKDKNYFGYFDFDNKLYCKNNKKDNLKNIVSIIDINWISKIESKNKWINTILNVSSTNNLNFINSVYAKNNSINNIARKEIIFEADKIKIDSIKKIENEIKKIIDQIEALIKKMQIAIKADSIVKMEKVYFEFVDNYKRYLKNRILILNKKNLNLMSLLFDLDKYAEKEYNKELEHKIFKLKNFIDGNNKKEIYKQSNEKSIKNNLKNTKAKNKLLIDIMKNSFVVNNKKYSKTMKLKSNMKFLLNSIFIKTFNNKVTSCLEYLSEEQTKIFIKEVEMLYLSTIYSLELEDNKNAIKKHTKKQLKDLINNYSQVSISNKKEINKSQQNIIDKETKEQELHKSKNKDEIEIKKIELKNLEDELVWWKNNLINQINIKIETIKETANDYRKRYNETNKKMYQLIEIFFNIKNNYINQHLNKTNKNEYLKLDDKHFIQETNKYKSIYKKEKEESKKINLSILNTYSNHNNNQSHNQKYLIKKYLIYKFATELNIDFFELNEKCNKSSNLLKGKMLLLKSLFKMNKIVALNNVFSLMTNDLEIEELKKLYHNVFKNQNLIWFIFDDNVKEIKSLVDNVYVFQNSNLIEYGNIKEVIKNPIYETTIKLLQIKTNKSELDFENKQQLELFKNFDNYKLANNHFIYANLETLYEYTKIIPEKHDLTNNQTKLEEFINEINFRNEINFNTDTITLLENEEKEKETIIFDVRKQI